MAPIFKKNMYQTYKKDTDTGALICFSSEYEKSIFQFRNRLVDSIEGINESFLYESEGKPTSFDSCLRLFPKIHKNRVEDFYRKKSPNIFAIIFNTRKAREYFLEAEEIAQLASLDISTSHDHPCIEIYSTLYSEEKLSQLINTVAAELNIKMAKNINLPAAADIIMSNRSFDM